MKKITYLQGRVASLELQLGDARKKLDVEENKELLLKLKEAYEGKYFKYRTCYSSPTRPSDYWFLYTHVIKIKGRYSAVVVRFDNDKKGKFTYSKEGYFSTNMLKNYKIITKAEYNTAFKKFLKSIVR